MQNEVQTHQLQVARLEDEGETLQRHRELSECQNKELDVEKGLDELLLVSADSLAWQF